jgi:hypothetical protein
MADKESTETKKDTGNESDDAEIPEFEGQELLASDGSDFEESSDSG